MDYKDSLLLPNTSFAMRGNLPENEPARYKKWDEMGVYNLLKRSGDADFTLHDGPPYANGHLHIGHSLNKILKDIIVKTHFFMGESVRYTPGWDCHGLPIEQQVEVKLGSKKSELSKSEIREHCRSWAREFVAIQKNEFKQLGVLGDWEDPYLTMKPQFEADIYRTLCEVAKKGLLIERSKPVFWSWAAKSALAEAEVEYEDKEDYSLFVSFELGDEAVSAIEKNADFANSVATDIKIVCGGKIGALIWTTTPWTLVANQAISLNPDEKYILLKEGYIIAKPLLEAIINQGISSGEIICEFSSKILENLFAINPLNGRKSRLILGEHVLMDGGSGLVHTAPGHGEDDYFVSLKYDIAVIMPVDESGLYDETIRRENLVPTELADEFIGLHIFKANDRIVELLGSSAVKVSKFTHSYPFCWRTHKPVIYRATKQWFIAMDKPFLNGKTLREVALNALNEVKFYPEAGRNRLTAMIENRPDWCISRQRDWGVPIAFFRDKKSGEPIFDEVVVENIAKIFDEKGADAWWDMSIEELLPTQMKNRASELEKCDGILDVWFDSGSTSNAVLKSGRYDAGSWPANMYLEGSDQHRGWFQSSLLLGCAVFGKAPFKSVLTHGFTVDAKGEKMSKSKGNVVAPDKVLKQYGSEILRLWVACSDYSGDLKISEDILKQVGEQYRKIRNTIRFLLANVNDLKSSEASLSDFCGCERSTNEADLASVAVQCERNSAKSTKEIGRFGYLDRWILGKAKLCFDEAHECFKNYDFSKGFNHLQSFLAGDLSGIYLDICKDRLYCDAADGAARRSAQIAMAMIAERLLALIAPVLTYTADEAIEAAPEVIKMGAKSAFDLVYQPLNEFKLPEHSELMEEARARFNELVDALKKDKTIKSTLELNIQTTSRRILGIAEAADWFMVSEIGEFADGDGVGEFAIADDKFKIVLASKNRCERCWKFNADSSCLCDRCKSVLKENNSQVG